MAEGPSYALKLFEDHERWEEYKFQHFLHPNSSDDAEDPGSNPNQRKKKTIYPDPDILEPEGADSECDSDSSEKQKDRLWAELNSRRMKPRRTLIRKEGQSNVAFRGIQKKRVRYLKDLYITLLDLKWRWAVLILFLGFFLCYFIFSIIYFLLSYTHGDFDNLHDPDFKPCIKNMESYWDALLFSIETQSTIGYGTIYPNAECAGTVPVVFIQITIGFLIETMLLGFIFVKIARPKHRRHTLIFSRNACLCQEDGHLTLQIRVGDIRNTHLIDTTVHGVLVKRYVSEEKHVYPLFQHDIEFEAHGMGDRVFLIWPMVLRHKITKESVLYTLTPEDLLYDKFELVIILEGTIESTGEMVQARTSYTSKEILWGHRFTRIEEYDEKNDRWCVDFVRFNNVVPSKTPKCSAKDFDSNPEEYKLTNTTEGNGAEKTTSSKRTSKALTASNDTLNYSTASEPEGERDSEETD